MDAQDKEELAALIAVGVAAAALKKQDASNEVAFALLDSQVIQIRKETDEIWRWKKDNEAVLLWAKNFMDNYRKIMTVVLTSGVLTTIGLLFQLYYMLSKGK